MTFIGHTERPPRPLPTRRSFLCLATAATGAVGAAAAAWPLIAQLGPDAATRATWDRLVEVDLRDLAPGEQRRVVWHRLPIFVVRRTPAMLAAMQEAGFVSKLVDPRSETRQQPGYARNWHRSIDPAYAVLVGVCTACACTPVFASETQSPDVAGGYVCPCCGARYDPAGRVYMGPTSHNLPVPPYDIVERSRIRIGRTSSAELFSLDQIERI